MLQKYNKFRVLQLFFREPTKEFHLREVARAAQIAPPSTKQYLAQLLQEEFIIMNTKGLYATYRADRESEQFKNLKKWTGVIELTTNGVVPCIIDRCAPDAIILFGSASRGDDIETSDIDIAIIAKEASLDLKRFEKQLKRTINPFFITAFTTLSSELKNNILNGIVLHGYVKVF